MFKSINQWSFPADYQLEDCIRLMQKAGFTAFEPAFSEEGEISLASAPGQIRAAGQKLRDAGIAPVSLASGLYWKYSLTSGSAQMRQKARDIVRAQLDAAAELEVDTILVVPGAVGSGFWGGDEFVYYDVAYDRSLEAFLELKAHAEKVKVHIGVENVWNKFLLSPLEMRDFIDKVGSGYVGAYLDVGNMLKDGFPEMWIRILGSRIKKVHVKDFLTSVGTLSGFVDLLCGDVNFPAVVRELKAIGYDGPLTAEMGADRHYPGDIVLRTSRALDVILKDA